MSFRSLSMAEADPDPLSLEDLVSVLRAAGEDTRLRILALLAEGELSVSDLTDILGQSQPRISRHLKLMGEAGIVERNREGSWAFFRIAGRGAATVCALLQALDPADPVVETDRARLAAVRQARAAAAETYFSRHAAEWDRIRSLHVAEAVVESAILDAVGHDGVRAVLDLGTGSGRMLTLFAPMAARVVGVDQSHAMLAVARANLERAGLRRAELRQGDIYALPVERGSFDLVVVHQVLHFLEDPARALREAAAALAPGGRMVVVDFAPHDLEFLRESQAHRRLGFARDQVEAWLGKAGLAVVSHCDLAAPADVPEGLTVSIWVARDRRAVRPLARPGREVA
jgi:ubiquinone/menaquinone biosynthesis C-methylase UbiE/DNA-binding transcriptional ArsR family regulator